MDPLDELMAAAGCAPPPVNEATRQHAGYAAAMRDHVRARWADAVADRADDADEADLVHATMADAPAPPADAVRDTVNAWAQRIQQSWAPAAAPAMPVTMDLIRDALARVEAMRAQARPPEPVNVREQVSSALAQYWAAASHQRASRWPTA